VPTAGEKQAKNVFAERSIDREALALKYFIKQ